MALCCTIKSQRYKTSKKPTCINTQPLGCDIEIEKYSSGHITRAIFFMLLFNELQCGNTILHTHLIASTHLLLLTRTAEVNHRKPLAEGKLKH